MTSYFNTNRNHSSSTGFVTAFCLALFVADRLGATEAAGRFASPEEAVTALAAIVTANNTSALREIFGSDCEKLINPDPVQATNEWAAFSEAFRQTNRLVMESETTRTLEIGTNGFPFPVPIVKKGDRWFFDTAAGVQELFNRRIGRDEIKTIQVMRAYVQAQREYASRDYDGDRVLEYAQKMISTPGAKDGLFWSPELDGEISPMGPLAADAAAEGYSNNPRTPDEELKPFHGYYFKILTQQGKHAPGGKYDYIINGNMVGGFALVAWPAEYGTSGIMTFIVNQQGRVYQKDLGPKTAKSAETMKAYDPDSTWSPSAD